jgi:hypothetical protein
MIPSGTGCKPILKPETPTFCWISSKGLQRALGFFR